MPSGDQLDPKFRLEVVTDSEAARAKQANSRMSYRENRSRKQKEREAEHDAIVKAVTDRLATTASRADFREREVSLICRAVVRQMADLINQQILVPITAREAADIAKIFAHIDQQDMLAKAMKKAAAGGAIDATALAGLPPGDRDRLLEVVARGRARQVVPGQVQQVGDIEDVM